MIITATPPADKDTKIKSATQIMLYNQISCKISTYNKQLPGIKIVLLGKRENQLEKLLKRP